jgi:ABC-type transport system involved in multi-copper enzyme maturation permease subunit
MGPILAFDLVRSVRRGWHHWFLWIYVGWLLFVAGVLFLLEVAAEFSLARAGQMAPDVFAAYARSLVVQLVGQQFVLLALVTPTFAAGSICDEKTRGTLQEWLTTDLSAWEILRDKLLTQVIQIGTLSLAVLPLLAFFGVFAGLNLLSLVMLLLTLLVQLTAFTAASLLASVWCRRTTTAVLASYAVLAAVFGGAWLLGIHQYLHPLYLLDEVWLEAASGPLGPRLARAGLTWGLVIVVCLGLAVWRLRPAYKAQLAAEGEGARSGSWRDHLLRPAVGSQPLRWKERYLGHLPAQPILRWLPRSWAVAAVSVLTVAIGHGILLAHLPAGVGLRDVLQMAVDLDVNRLAQVWRRSTPAGLPFLALSLTAAALFSLGVGIRCAGVVTSERERKTWEVLLTTPLEPGQILRGKLWGIIDSVRPLLLAYVLPAAGLAFLAGVEALVWVLFWWAVTWMMMYYMGATGVHCSVRSLSSWRSLLATLLSNAWVIFLRYVMLGAPVGILVTGLAMTIGSSLLTRPFATTLFAMLFVVVSTSLALVWLFAEAEFQLAQAERWIWEHDRVTPLAVRLQVARRKANDSLQ